MKESKQSPLAKFTPLIVVAFTSGFLIGHFSNQNEIRIGEYQGYRIEAFKEGDYRKVIISPENGPERIIATDLPGGKEFESIESFLLSDDNPLNKLNNSKNAIAAWNYLWKR